MSNSVYEIDFTRLLPNVLKQDEKIFTLGKVISEQLQKNIHLSKQAIIYAKIDELSENILDILAYDLHVDWYKYDYPVDVKKDIIKNSVRVHKRLGTKYAVEKALGDLLPNCVVQEWFEYGGLPSYFRILVDTQKAKIKATSREIIDIVKFYKRLSAHIDEIVYYCKDDTILIHEETKAYHFVPAYSGTVLCGMLPL